MECSTEAPENATIIITCNNKAIFKKVYLVDYTPYNITGKILSVEAQLQYCNLTIAFGNTINQLIFPSCKTHNKFIYCH